jgi:hypothetical protein
MHVDPNGEAFLTIMLITAGSLALKAGASVSLVLMAKIALGIAAGVSLKYILEQVKEESEKADKKYTVYALKDSTGEIVYVGRVLTENYEARMAHHGKTGRGTPVIRIDNLTYMQCRGLEQAGILAHSTLGKENKINGISAINPMGQHYNIAAKAVRYFRNQLENEYFNLFDRKG